ncbi:MAG: hypothetical protein Q4F02_00965 [Candidatus Saccharibacteria bacterium]|nr:hypothetical protein [Candidatus Saccharibacteria bacterium]
MGQSQTSSSPQDRRINIAIAVASLLGLFILCDLAFLGNTMFYVKWAECGRKPIILYDPNPLDAARSRQIIDPPALALKRGYPHYICSLDDSRVN